ncbi:MAG: hypothetical protein H0V81_02320 [Solirubrobacterales bacterium]|nr:hypothetical protein [Solirubrobacterales bacterium]
MDQGQHRTERVIFETERHRITGMLTLPRDGYRSRVSDLLNAAERDFVSLTDVTITRIDGSDEPESHAFLAVSRHHIVLAIDVE